MSLRKNRVGIALHDADVLVLKLEEMVGTGGHGEAAGYLAAPFPYHSPAYVT